MDVNAALEVTLRIAEDAGVARTAELARGGVPLPRGTLYDVDRVRLRDDLGVDTPLQATVRELWDDGSIRWLAVGILADVPRQDAAEYTLAVDVPRAPDHEFRASATECAKGVEVDTGAVSFLVRRAPLDPLVGFPGVAGFRILTRGHDDTECRADLDSDVTLRVLEQGPLIVRVLATGRYRARDGATLLDFEVELEAVAGGAEVTLDCRLVNRERAPSSSISEWRAELELTRPESACCGVFDAIHETRSPLALRQDGSGHLRGIFAVSTVDSAVGDWDDAVDPAYRDRWEWAELQGRHGSNWVDVRCAAGDRVAVAVPRFVDDQPSELRFDAGGVTIGLWPAGAGALELTQGMAATRRIALSAHDGEGIDASRFAARMATPLLVATGEWPLASGVVAHLLPCRAQHHPGLESYIREELFSWCLVGQATGFLDRGDCMQVPLGPRAGFTANNEHDALLALCLHYLRSGERAYFDSAESYADHLADVDVVHHSERNRFETGGVRAHGRNHVHYVPARTAAGAVETSVDTGHMWVEGLLLFSAISGRDRYAEVARGIGDCLLRLEEIGWTRPEPGPRNSGWPLVALSALYAAGRDERYLVGARRIAQSALAAQGADGRWTMRLGFWDGYCAWQNCVLLTGLARLLSVDPDPSPAVEASFRTGADALLELGRYEDGGFIYLDRFDYRWVSRTGLIREALAAAYELTGEERFLAAGLEGGSAWYRPSGGVATSNDIAEWRGHLPFLGALERAGLLQDLDSARVPAQGV